MRCVVAAAAGHNATLWGRVCFDGEEVLTRVGHCWFVVCGPNERSVGPSAT